MEEYQFIMTIFEGAKSESKAKRTVSRLLKILGDDFVLRQFRKDQARKETYQIELEQRFFEDDAAKALLYTIQTALRLGNNWVVSAVTINSKNRLHVDLYYSKPKVHWWPQFDSISFANLIVGTVAEESRNEIDNG